MAFTKTYHFVWHRKEQQGYKPWDPRICWAPEQLCGLAGQCRVSTFHAKWESSLTAMCRSMIRRHCLSNQPNQKNTVPTTVELPEKSSPLTMKDRPALKSHIRQDKIIALIRGRQQQEWAEGQPYRRKERRNWVPISWGTRRETRDRKKGVGAKFSTNTHVSRAAI